MHGCWLTGMVAIYESSKGVEESKVKGTGNITPHQVSDVALRNSTSTTEARLVRFCYATGTAKTAIIYPSSYQLASCPCAH